ncbi:MAG TPA: two-component regulator propeller domain-containing protein, partial [Bacteroidales bacterium]|nr:two-component regulator propeller domain-containing protein [Bacteroidales bacterium]
DNTVRTIFEDHSGKIWIGTQNAGLELYNSQTDGFIHFRHNDNDNKTPSGNTIRSIGELGSKYLCIGTYGSGFDLMDLSTYEFRNFRHTGNRNSLCHNNIMSMMTDRNGKLWIGTENGGLSIFDIKSGDFYNYRNDPFDQSSLNNNSIYALYEDVSGNIWLGTWNGGINLVNRHAQQFIHYRHSSNAGSLSDNHVLCITEDRDGMIWVGTDGGGLNMLDPKTGNFINFRHNPSDKNSLCGDYVLSVCEDSRGEIWIGTYGSGISIYNKKNRTFRNLKSNQHKPQGITSDYIWFIYKDSRNRMWIGMCPGGVNVYDPATGNYTYFAHDNKDPNSLIHNNIHSIYEDSKGNMWIGTNGGGLDRIDRSGKITHFQHDPNKNSISHNCLGHLIEDQKGNLWIGTDGGLDYLDAKTQTITNFENRNGLPDCFIYGILEDREHKFWISSSEGLIHYDPESGKSKRFTVADGLQSNEFNLNAFCISRTGEMYFGGSNGMNRFHPDSLLETSSDYKLVITDFLIFNKSVPVGDDSPASLQHNISYTREIRLPYEASVFSFEFAALNYLEPGSNGYTYKMENFDKDWNEVRLNRTATYTNLDPGQYVFKVRGGPGTGLSTENPGIKIIIVPPFWMTWWFRIAVLTLIACFFLVIYSLRIRAIKKRNLLLERKVEERTSRIVEMNGILKDQTTELNRKNQELEQLNCHLNELNATKDKFFSIIAHDLKNPFNAILGFSEMLATNYDAWKDEKTGQVLKLLYNSAQNLFNLLENLLEWSRSQRGIMEFNPEILDLQVLLQDSINLFTDSLMAKNLNLIISDPGDRIAVYADKQMLGTMIRNLISNAIKYTNKNGEIKFSSNFNGMETFISVSDNGVGMSSEKSARLFCIDSGGSTPGTNNEKGTGLGLLLTREFVSRHGGEITVSSEAGKGSTFTISLPWKKGRG